MANAYDAGRWIKGAAKSVADHVKGPFTARQVPIIEPTFENFSAFGNPDFAAGQNTRQTSNADWFNKEGSATTQRQLVDANAANQGREAQYAQAAALNAASGEAGKGAGYLNDVGNQYIAYANNGPGPSAAEAQLNMSTNQNMRNALALAKSGRGGTGNVASLAAADASRSQAQSDAAGNLSLLRAKEADAWRGRQLEAYGGATNAYGASVGATGTQANILGKGADIYGEARNQDLGQQDQYLKQAQINDAAQQELYKRGLESEGLAFDYAQMDQTGRMGYEGLRSANYNTANTANAASDAQRDAAIWGGLSGVAAAGMSIISDKNLKHKVEALSSAGKVKSDVNLKHKIKALKAAGATNGF